MNPMFLTLAATSAVLSLNGVQPPTGPMMFVGGGPDQPTIMKTFVTLSGGPARSLLIVPLASDHPTRSGDAYVAFLKTLGAPHAAVLLPHGNPSAADLDAIAHAGGCFFSGGDQSRLLRALTPAWRRAFQAASRRGAVMAGTSAGAMIWGDAALLGGGPVSTIRYGGDARHGGVTTGVGLGLAPGWLVDTHFSERGRVPRLAFGVASTHSAIGLGVDQETAAIVRPDGSIEAAGRGTVTVLQMPSQQAKVPLSLRDVHLDFLSAGDRLRVAKAHS